MTDDSTQPPVPEEAASAQPPPTPAASPSAFSGGLGMAALGALVLLGDWLVFGVLLNDYWVGWAQLLLAFALILLWRTEEATAESAALVPNVAKFVGYLLALMGLVALIEDLRFPDGTLNEFPDVIGAIVAYAGYVLAFLGARGIET